MDKAIPGSYLAASEKPSVILWDNWREMFKNFIDIYISTPVNYSVENAIRPSVTGRKNLLFTGSQEVAYANASLYSPVETAKA